MHMTVPFDAVLHAAPLPRQIPAQHVRQLDAPIDLLAACFPAPLAHICSQDFRTWLDCHWQSDCFMMSHEGIIAIALPLDEETPLICHFTLHETLGQDMLEYFMQGLRRILIERERHSWLGVLQHETHPCSFIQFRSQASKWSLPPLGVHRRERLGSLGSTASWSVSYADRFLASPST